jgi:hypothetical protein
VSEHVLCHSCGVLHPYEMKPRTQERAPVNPGTHEGKLDEPARARRAAKNARNKHNREARAAK